jgi:hypothetical protein
LNLSESEFESDDNEEWSKEEIALRKEEAEAEAEAEEDNNDDWWTS